jgi:hypothetical protein
MLHSNRMARHPEIPVVKIVRSAGTLGKQGGARHDPALPRDSGGVPRNLFISGMY